MSKIVILFVFLAVFQIASALKCYKCDNCEESPSSWEIINCGSGSTILPLNYEWACLKFVYKDRMTYNETEQRKCLIAERKNNKIVNNCPTSMEEPTACPLCQTDLCNSAPTNFKFSFVAFASIIVAFIALKFL